MRGSGARAQSGWGGKEAAKLEVGKKKSISRYRPLKTPIVETPGAMLTMKTYGRKKFPGDAAKAVKVQIAGTEGPFALEVGKVVVKKLGVRQNHLTGAMLDLDGERFVLLSGDTVASKMRFTKTSPGRIEIAVGAAEDVEVDDVEATFLSMKAAAFSQGKLTLSKPLSSADWQSSFGELIASANRDADAARHALFEDS